MTTTKTTNRTPRHDVDAGGAEITRVPLARGGWATLDREDFDWMQAEGLSDQWTFNQGESGNRYVRCGMARATGRLVGVARVIMQAPKGRIVKYLDGDRLNLRRSNLYLAEGRAGAREVALIQRPGSDEETMTAKRAEPARAKAVAMGAPQDATQGAAA